MIPFLGAQSEPYRAHLLDATHPLSLAVYSQKRERATKYTAADRQRRYMGFGQSPADIQGTE